LSIHQKKNDHVFQKNQIIQEKRKKKKPLVSWEDDDLPGVWLTGPKTRKKKTTTLAQVCKPRRERERLVGVILSFVSLTLAAAAAAPGDMTGPHQTAAGQWERSRRFLKKESLSTWATHAKKTHTRERRRDTLPPNNSSPQGRTDRWWWVRRCTEEIVHHEKKKMANTHTHVPGTTLGLDVCTRPKNMCLQSHPGNLWKGK
jgi:hypothetical protein